MNSIELIFWGFLTLILMKYNEKPIYKYLQDIKDEYYKFITRNNDENLLVVLIEKI
jgi:hypothetical protein